MLRLRSSRSENFAQRLRRMLEPIDLESPEQSRTHHSRLLHSTFPRRMRSFTT